jgi:hypothetical protein
MSNKFCSYPVSDCQLSSLLASYEQRIDNLQTALGNLELDAILVEVQKLEDTNRINELEAALEKAIEALVCIGLFATREKAISVFFQSPAPPSQL